MKSNFEKIYNEIKERHRYQRSYFIHDSDKTSLNLMLAYHDSENKQVTLYKIPNKNHWHITNGLEYYRKWMYIKMVKKYTYKKILFGHHPPGEYTFLKESTSFQNPKNFYGNSLLLQLTKSKYVFIGDEIIEFTIPTNDEIIEFYSPIQKFDGIWPVAIGRVNTYFPISWNGIDYVSNVNLKKFLSKLLPDEFTKKPLYAQYFEASITILSGLGHIQVHNHIHPEVLVDNKKDLKSVYGMKDYEIPLQNVGFNNLTKKVIVSHESLEPFMYD